MDTAFRENAKMVIGSYDICLPDGTPHKETILDNGWSDGNALPGFTWGRVIHYSVFQNLRFPEGYWFENSIMAHIVHPCAGIPFIRFRIFVIIIM